MGAKLRCVYLSVVPHLLPRRNTHARANPRHVDGLHSSPNRRRYSRTNPKRNKLQVPHGWRFRCTGVFLRCSSHSTRTSVWGKDARFHNPTQHNTAQHNTQHNTSRHNTAQYNAPQHHATHYNTTHNTQHSTARKKCSFVTIRTSSTPTVAIVREFQQVRELLPPPSTYA